MKSVTVRIVVLTACLVTANVSLAQTNNWQGAPGVPGSWNDPANWSIGVPAAGDDVYIQNGGTAVITEPNTVCSGMNLAAGTVNLLSGSLGAGGIGLGSYSSGYGTFNHSGGRSQTSSLDVYSGTYNLSGTGWLNVGSEWTRSSGVFNQSGGTHIVQNSMYIDGGTYNLTSTGILSAGWEYIERGGYFLQAGGQHWLAGCLVVGDTGGVGTYRLLSGELISAGTQIGGWESSGGTFIQEGGTHIASAVMISNYNPYPSDPPPMVSYILNGGSLISRQEFVGSGGTTVFHQNGGSNCTGSLAVVDTGRYEMSGGSLCIQNGLDIQGTLDLMGGNGQVKVSQGLVDLTTGTIANSQNASLSLGKNAILVAAPGYDPNTAFSHFSNQGITHTAGTTWIIPAGERLAITQGKINDLVDCAGTIDVPGSDVYSGVQLNGGLILRDGAYVHLGDHGGGIVVNDDVSRIEGGTLDRCTIIVGKEGSGSMTQTGGTAKDCSLVLGNTENGNGTYTLSGGTFSADQGEEIGYRGQGTFNHTGGQNTIKWALRVGCDPNSTGVYNLQGTGKLTASEEMIGLAGRGVFRQSGGENIVGESLRLGDQAGSEGTYELSGGFLSSPEVKVGVQGTGTFIQTGGVHQAGLLAIGPNGQYEYSGGDLQIQGGLRVDGTLDLTNAAASLTFAGGIVDVSAGTVANASNASLSMDAHSLLIVASGFDPAATFKQYANEGLTHVAGTDLAIESGREIFGAGEIRDRVVCSGTLAAKVGMGINLNNGLTVSGGNVELGTGSLTVSDAQSGMTGGTLVADGLRFSPDGNGVFTQLGGKVTITGNDYDTGLVIGNYNSENPGTYNLEGTGELDANSVTIYSGIFNQSGGTLSAQREWLETYGTQAGVFNHTGGTNTTGYLLISGHATYSLSGTGELIAGNEYIRTWMTDPNAAAFRQSGGVNDVGYLEFSGRYQFSGGVLRIRDGMLIQKNGILDCADAATDITAGGIIDLSQGQIVNAEQMSMTVGADSLTLYAPGHDPAAIFKNFHSDGLVHEVGTPLIIPAGKTVQGTGTISDHVTCMGILKATNAYVSLKTGLTVLDGALVDLGNGDLTVTDQTSGMEGGQLHTLLEQIGADELGAFTQTAGEHTVDQLCIGGNASGRYVSAGGELTANTMYMGGGGSGEGVLEITNPEATIQVSDNLCFGRNGKLTAVEGATIHLGSQKERWGDVQFQILNMDPATLADLDKLTLAVDDPNRDCLLEVAGRDVGEMLYGFENNFALGALVIGESSPTWVTLVDQYINHTNWSGDEALYVRYLFIAPGSHLDLNGLNLYYLEGSINVDPSAIINGTITQVVPEPLSLAILLAGIGWLSRRRSQILA